MSPLRHVAFVGGLLLIVVLLSRLPADVFATTQAMLVLTAGALLLLLAAAMFLTPPRRLIGRLFGFGVRDGPAFAMAREPEWRDLVRPLFAALVCLAAAGVPTLLR